MKNRISPLNALASSSLVALALATGASTALADNPFAATSLDAGYQVADHHKSKEAKCGEGKCCLLYTSPSPRDLSTSRMPSSA